MKVLNEKNWKAIFLLSIVVPVSLLATFRLMGILKEPIILENITLDTVAWEFQRPDTTGDITEVLSASYIDNGCMIKFVVEIGEYIENFSSHYGADCIGLRVEVNASAISDVFISNVYVIIHKDCNRSLVAWVPGHIDFENLSLLSLDYEGWTNGDEYREAYISLSGSNNSSDVSFAASAMWDLLTPNDQTHQTEIGCEVTYLNGTAYKKIIQPFNLKIIG